MFDPVHGCWVLVSSGSAELNLSVGPTMYRLTLMEQMQRRALPAVTDRGTPSGPGYVRQFPRTKRRPAATRWADRSCEPVERASVFSVSEDMHNMGPVRIENKVTNATGSK